MMKRKKLVYFLLLINVVSYGQVDSFLDSIEKLYNQTKYEEVVSKSSQIKVFKNSQDSLTNAKILSLKSNAYYELGNYKEAIVTGNQSILYSPDNEEGNNQKGMMLFDKAFSEYALQDYQTSYLTVKEAERILTVLKKPNLDYLLSIYADIAGTAIAYGYLEEAEYYILKGISVYEKNRRAIKSSVNQASKDVLFQYKLIELYSSKKEEENLVKQIREFAILQKQRKFNSIENQMYAVSLNIVGDFYLNNLEAIGKEIALDKGRYYIEQALEVLDVKKYPDNEIQFKFNLAKQLRYNKEFKKALKINEEIIEKTKTDDDRIPFFYAQRGIIYLEQKNLDLAYKQFFKMISFIHKGEEVLVSNFTNFQPSEELNHTGLLVEIPSIIKKHFPKNKKATKLLSRMYRMGFEQFKNCYRNEELNFKLKNYYDLAVDGILKNKDFNLNAILNSIEMIENRLAWKEFLQNRKHTKDILPDSIFDYELTLRKKIVEARKNKNSSEVISLEKKIENHRSYVSERFPMISTSISMNFDIANFQKKIDDTSCILKYKRINDVLYLFKITKRDVALFTLDFTSEIRSQVKEYITIVKNRKEDKVKGELLFKNLIPFSLDEFSDLTIVPDDILHHLPFEALVDKKAEYLIYNQPISYGLYLALLKNDGDTKNEEIQIYRPSYTKDFTKGNPIALKGAEKEVKQISQLFETTLFEGNKVNKQLFLKRATKAKILHLPMHASINNLEPELSHFIFSITPEEKLYMEELYGIKLQAELAVLSACSTGEGTIDDIEGHISLQRAFTYAGVSSTMSSLWEVSDDATQQVIIAFYKYLKEGNSKSKSLQLAKLEYLENNDEPALKAPYYWSAFVISGDIAPLQTESYWSYLFIVIFLLIILIFRRFIGKNFKNT